MILEHLRCPEQTWVESSVRFADDGIVVRVVCG